MSHTTLHCLYSTKVVRVFRAVAVASVMLAVTGGSFAKADDLPTIRAGWVVPVTNLTSILFEKRDLAVHLDKTYHYQATRFANTPAMVTALATGDVDIAELGYSAFGIAVVNAGMDDLRIIVDEFRDGVDGYYTGRYWVLKDSPIKQVEDLKGHVIAIGGAGGAMDIAMKVMFAKHGIDSRKDVTEVEMGLPNMRSVLESHKADLIMTPLPFSEEPALQSIGRVLFTQKEASGGPTDMIFWAARAPFLAKNHAAMVDFLEDAVREARYLTDPVNHQEAVNIAAAFTKQPASNFDDWLFTKKDYYRNPELVPDLDALQTSFDQQAKVGFLKRSIDVQKYADLSLIKEADARVK